MNNADRLAFDPVMPQGVRGRAVDAKAASTRPVIGTALVEPVGAEFSCGYTWINGS